MFSFNRGYVENSITGDRSDVVVRMFNSGSIRDLVIGGITSILGIGYLVYSSFKNGSYAYELAEYNALCDAGIIKENNSNTDEMVTKDSYVQGTY